MRIRRLRLKDFFSYADAELDLSGVSLCSVVGPNGSGKSSLIVEAVLWAVFGHAKLANKDLVRSGTSETRVDLEFELDEHRYEITRSFGKAMEVSLRVDGKPVAQGKKNQVEELLRRLGVDRDLLLHSVVVSQGQLSSFVSAAPAERRELVRDMLGLKRFDKAHETARAAHLTMRTTIEAHDRNVGALRQRLQRLPESTVIQERIRAIKARVDQALAEQVELVARRGNLVERERAARDRSVRLTDDVARLQRRRIETNAQADRLISESEKTLTATDQEVTLLPQYREAVAALDAEATAAEEVLQQIKVIQSQRASLDAEENEKRDRYQFLASRAADVCPLCGSQIGVERFQKILLEMKAELEALFQKREALVVPKTPSSPKTIREQAEGVRKQVAQMELRRDQRPQVVERLASLRQNRDAAIKEIDEEAARATAELAQAQGQLSAEVDVLTTQIERSKATHQQANLELERANGEWVEQESLLRQLEEAQANLTLSQTRFPETEFVAGALAPSGIQLMIVDHYLPLIEGRSQDLLTKMSDGQLSLQLRTLEGRGVELLAGSDHLRPVRALSGGEQTRVSLAVRLALSQVLSEMVGMRWDMVIVDEPEWLDPAGIDQFIQAVHRLSAQFPQIFVISHYPELQRAFPSTIMVRKTDGVSQVEVQA